MRFGCGVETLTAVDATKCSCCMRLIVPQSLSATLDEPEQHYMHRHAARYTARNCSLLALTRAWCCCALALRVLECTLCSADAPGLVDTWAVYHRNFSLLVSSSSPC